MTKNRFIRKSTCNNQNGFQLKIQNWSHWEQNVCTVSNSLDLKP